MAESESRSNQGILVLTKPSADEEKESSLRNFDVIAVHGLAGHRETSWTHESDGKKIMWLSDLLPNNLEHARIMTFGYDLKGQEGISTAEISGTALELLEELRHWSCPDDNSSLVFIGHDLGGVIIKQALLIATSKAIYSSIATKTSLLIFFGTPHRAPDLGLWEWIVCNLLFTSGHKYQGQLSGILKHSAQALRKVSEEFQMIARIYSVFSVFEQREHPHSTSPVDWKHSATLDLPGETHIGLDKPSVELCKFSDAADAAFMLICEKINDCSGVNDQYIDCLKTLSALDCKDYLPRATDAYPGAFEWLKSHQAYMSWLTSSETNCLLLYGDIGSGMSLLASYLVKHVLTAIPDATIIRFSFDFNDDRHRSTYRMLASLCYQILSLKPELFNHVSLLYELMANESNWKIDRLWAFFRSMLTYPYQGPTVCLIEGIDECEPFQSRYLEDLLQLPQSIYSHFKLIATSRASLDHGRPAIVINFDEINTREEDVKRILAMEISKIAQRRPGFRKFEHEIQKKFLCPPVPILHATLALTLLEAAPVPSTHLSIRRELEWLPVTVEGISRHVLDRIPRDYSTWARSALSWIIFALRPLTLSELAVALALKLDTNSLWDIECIAPQEIALNLERLFGPLLMIRNDEVFVHKTFHHFLLAWHNHEEQESLSLSRFDNHAIIAQKCLKYLAILLTEVPEGIYDEDEPDIRLPQWDESRNSLLFYAVQYWPEHYRNANDLDHETSHSVFTFMTNRRLITMWSQLYWSSGDPAIRRSVSFNDPLLVAVALSCLNLVPILLDDARDKAMTDPGMLGFALELAVERGDQNLVSLLLNSGAKSARMMHIAASHGHDHLIWRFLAEGTSVAEPDDTGSIPLHYASESGCLGVVQKLLSAGSDVYARTMNNSTPLHLASQFGHADVTGQLLKANADPNSVDDNGSTPLHVACMWQQPGAIATLLEVLVNIEAVDNNGLTPLHLATKAGRLDILRTLLRHYSRQHTDDPTAINDLLDIKDAIGSTLLHVAAREGYVDIMKELLDHVSEYPGAAAVEDDFGCVPLHLGAKYGHREVVNLLLKADASQIQTPDNESSMPIHLAVHNGHVGVVRLLCNQHLALDISLDVFDSSSLSPLHLASQTGSTKIVELLLEYDAEPDIADDNNDTPLLLASRGGFVEMVRQLLDAGAYAMSTNVDGFSPLHVASQTGNVEVVRLLLVASRKLLNGEEYPNLADNEGRTPIHLAAQRGHLGVMKELLESGADLKAVDKKQRSVLHFAAQGGHLDQVKSFLDDIQKNARAANQLVIQRLNDVPQSYAD